MDGLIEGLPVKLETILKRPPVNNHGVLSLTTHLLHLVENQLEIENAGSASRSLPAYKYNPGTLKSSCGREVVAR